MFYFPHSHPCKVIKKLMWIKEQKYCCQGRNGDSLVDVGKEGGVGGAGASKNLELGYICFCNKHFWGRLLCSRHRTKYILCVFSIKTLRTTP